MIQALGAAWAKRHKQLCQSGVVLRVFDPKPFSSSAASQGHTAQKPVILEHLGRRPEPEGRDGTLSVPSGAHLHAC